MPYTTEQCAKFAIMEKEGKKVPADWKKHCKKKKSRKGGKR